jgi:hypothetical protein
VLYAIWQLPFVLIAHFVFDRYLLVFLPATLLILLRGAEPIRRDWIAGVACLGVFVGLSLALTHDWLSWNAARWKLGRRAIASSVHLTNLEGGFEWDNWFAPDPNRNVPPTADSGLTMPLNRKRHPNLTGRFGLSLTYLPGTRTVDQEPFSTWLYRSPQTFYLLEREDPTESWHANKRTPED